MSARVRMLAVVVSSVLLAGVGLPAPAVAARAPEAYVRAPNGAIYVLAGGAPLWVSDWAAVGRTTVPPDCPAGSPPGTAGCIAPAGSLTGTPGDGTFLRGPNASDPVYRVVHGRPYLTTWAEWGGEQTYYVVDPGAITSCDTRQHATVPVVGGHLSCSPWGAVDSVTALGPDTVQVKGWAMDPDTTDKVSLSYWVDSAPRTGNGALANKVRPGLNAIYRRGDTYGFDEVLTGVGSGSRTICVFAANLGPYGQQTRLGCGTTVVPAPPLPPTAFPSAPRKVKAVAKSRKAVVRWKPPTSSGDGPILKYVVRASTGQTATTTKTKALVRRLKPGKKVSFSVVAYNKFGAGAESRRTKKIAILR